MKSISKAKDVPGRQEEFQTKGGASCSKDSLFKTINKSDPLRLQFQMNLFQRVCEAYVKQLFIGDLYKTGYKLTLIYVLFPEIE